MPTSKYRRRIERPRFCFVVVGSIVVVVDRREKEDEEVEKRQMAKSKERQRKSSAIDDWQKSDRQPKNPSSSLVELVDLHHGNNDHAEGTSQDNAGGVEGRGGVGVLGDSRGLLAAASRGGNVSGRGEVGGGADRGRRRDGAGGGVVHGGGDGVNLREGHGLGDGRARGAGGGALPVFGENKGRKDGEEDLGELHCVGLLVLTGMCRVWTLLVVVEGDIQSVDNRTTVV